MKSFKNLLLGEDRTLVSALFLRGLGFCYFFEWLNLTPQVLEIWGQGGALPIYKTLAGRAGLDAFLSAPTLFWFSSSDWFLLSLSILSLVTAVFVLLGARSPILFLLLWMVQLSFSTVGFGASFHAWDRLLLEVGFLAIFLNVRIEQKTIPFAPILLLLNLVLFRLHFQNGIEKFLNPFDPSWIDLTFLKKFWTVQPSPNFFSWVAFQLPTEIQKTLAYFTFFVEIVAPAMIFGPKTIRIVFFTILTVFQFGIFLTANFEIFNLLTVTLAVLVLRDIDLPPWLHSLSQRFILRNQFESFTRLLGWSKNPTCDLFPPTKVGVLIFVMLFPAHFLHLRQTFSKENSLVSDNWVFQNVQKSSTSQGGIPLPTHYLVWISRFHLLNSYGLFGGLPLARYSYEWDVSKNGQDWNPFEKGNVYSSHMGFPFNGLLLHRRLASELWNASIGLNFIEMQNHHSLYNREIFFEEKFIFFLRSQMKDLEQLRMRVRVCDFNEWRDFSIQKMNWWRCGPSLREVLFR